MKNQIVIGKAIANSLKKIDDERSGKQIGYLTRFNNFNHACLRYMRPSIIQFSGLSDNEKSTFLNILIDDITNVHLNRQADKSAAVLYFSFSRSSTDQCIKMLVRKNRITFDTIFSCGVKGEFFPVEEDLYNKIQQDSVDIIERNITFVDERLSYNACEEVVDNFIKELDLKEQRLVVVVDDISLAEKNNERTDADLVKSAGLFFINIRRKYDCLVLFSHSLNSDILSSNRTNISKNHFPTEFDIAYYNQINWACDDIFIIHNPYKKLNITKYGKNKLDCRGIIHMIKVKTGFGSLGNLWFKDDLQTGDFGQISNADIENLSDIKSGGFKSLNKKP